MGEQRVEADHNTDAINKQIAEEIRGETANTDKKMSLYADLLEKMGYWSEASELSASAQFSSDVGSGPASYAIAKHLSENTDPMSWKSDFLINSAHPDSEVREGMRNGILRHIRMSDHNQQAKYLSRVSITALRASKTFLGVPVDTLLNSSHITSPEFSDLVYESVVEFGTPPREGYITWFARHADQIGWHELANRLFDHTWGPTKSRDSVQHKEPPRYQSINKPSLSKTRSELNKEFFNSLLKHSSPISYKYPPTELQDVLLRGQSNLDHNLVEYMSTKIDLTSSRLSIKYLEDIPSTKSRRILINSVITRLRRGRWEEQASFIVKSTLISDLKSATKMAKKIRHTDGSKDPSVIWFEHEFGTHLLDLPSIPPWLTHYSRKIGWSRFADSLQRGSFSVPTEEVESAAKNISDPKIEPIAVVLVGDTVTQEISRQFRSVKDYRLDSISRFLAEELTIHRHWRLRLSQNIPVKAKSSAGNVSVIDITVYGKTSLYIQFFQSNGIVLLPSGSEIDQLGLSSNKDAQDRSNDPFRLLTNIALVYVFGENGSIFKTLAKEDWMKARKASGNKFYPTDVYRIDRLLENHRARRILPDLVEVPTAVESSISRKKHNVRGHKRRKPSGGYSPIPAHQRGGRKRK